MRKHTFRLWDQRDKKMIYPATDENYSFNLFGDGSFHITALALMDGKMRWQDRAYKDFVIMENTGLKDCIGKEIWEGDLISYSEHYSGDYLIPAGSVPILWYQDMAGFGTEKVSLEELINQCVVRVVGNTIEGRTSNAPTVEQVKGRLTDWFSSRHAVRDGIDDDAVYKYLSQILGCIAAQKDGKA